MKANGISVFVGLIITIFLCLLWPMIIGSTDPMYLWPGILAILVIVFFPGLKTVEIEHMEVLKILGKRWPIWFKEGVRWILWFMASTENISGKEEITDVPPIKALSKNNVPLILDAWIRWKTIDPIAYLSLENPKQKIDHYIISACNDAGGEYIKNHTDARCEKGKGEIQDEIKRIMTKEIADQCGIEITNVDIRPILPSAKIMDEIEEDKKKELRIKRFKKSLEEIKEGAPGITDDTLVNTAQVVEKTVEKKIEEKKTTFKLDVEPDILKTIAEFLPKKKIGGKK